MKLYSGEITADRSPIAAGRFYSFDKTALKEEVTALFKSCKTIPIPNNARAIISPHAGYVYSGKISASAYATVYKDIPYKNIFIIGSSHYTSFNGASIYKNGDYITPLGKCKVNRKISEKIASENSIFRFEADSHIQEHSIEVQIPFIQCHFKTVPPIIPIIIGTGDKKIIKEIANVLKPWFTPDNLFVISSDFSHYPSYDQAIETDMKTAESILSLDPETFLSTLDKNSKKNIPGLSTSMCGWSSCLMLLFLAEQEKDLEAHLIDYCNSGDSVYGDKLGVVGYHAITINQKEQINSDNQNNLHGDISFKDDEISMLFSIAKNSIKSELYNEDSLLLENKQLTNNLTKNAGAFVTLKISGVLRGCIGQLSSSSPLHRVISESAKSAAFHDPRFSPITKEEFKNSEIEITVLGPLVKIERIEDIILGKHGIYIKKGNKSGTMLPQVAIENGWTREDFLGYTSKHKAGLGWNGWKDSEIFIYEGIVLKQETNR